MKRLEVSGRLVGLIGLGVVLGAVSPDEVTGVMTGLFVVAVAFAMVIVGRELK